MTAEPDFSPPRVKVLVTAPAGSTFNQIAVYRVVAGVRTLVRSQPAAGFSTALTYDYECERNTPVTYEADYSSASAPPVVLSETWSSGWDSRWSGYTSYFESVGGFLDAKGPSSAFKTIWRFSMPATSRITTSLTAGGVLEVWQADEDDYFTITAGVGAGNTGVTIQWTQNGAGGILNASGPDLDIVFAAMSTSVNGVSFPYVMSALNQLAFEATSTLESASISAITLYGVSPSTPAVEDSAPVTLVVADGWIIHPAVPAKSFKLSIDDTQVAGIRSIGDVGNKATSTLHPILGQALPIVSWSSPRQEDDLTLSVAITTRAEEQALKACLSDQVPVLIRIPDSAGVGWDDGFFSVGDVNRARLAQVPNLDLRTVDLPLTRTQSPVVTQENAGWSWAALAATFVTWNDVAAAYATWADVAVDNRRPGF